MVIYDEFRGQLTDAVHFVLDSNNIYVVKVPLNCTDRLQSMDLSVNRSIKEFLCKKFCIWYAEQVERKLAGNDTSIVDLKMSIVKPIGASWFKSLHAYLQENQTLADNSFRAAGIFDVLRCKKY